MFHPWLVAMLDGLLLAGVLVSGWELAEAGSRSHWRWVFQGLGVLLPAVLVPLQRLGAVPVPWGVWAVALAGAWQWLPPWAGIGATIVSMGGWMGARDPNWAPAWHAWLGLVTLALMALLAAAVRATDRRVWSRWLWIAGYAMLVMVALAVSGLNGDSGLDSVRTAMVAVLVSGYVVHRARREAQMAEAQAHAMWDTLTGALTRWGFARWLETVPPAARISGCVVALDLDDFKVLNDTWGHAVGDRLLQEVVARLRAGIRQGDAVVRPGGDEFTVWMPGVPADRAPEQAERLHAAITAEPFVVGEEAFPLTVSVGWAAGPLATATAEAADAALLRAKRAGKDLVCGPEAQPRAAGPDPAAWLVTAADRLWRTWEQAAVLTDRNG
ncbi:MAG: GGDEF domain-containing protein, partial [Firmicutes bacterium]|nr:GGDEF domain-containing protein [Bacillota bacterium]